MFLFLKFEQCILRMVKACNYCSTITLGFIDRLKASFQKRRTHLNLREIQQIKYPFVLNIFWLNPRIYSVTRAMSKSYPSDLTDEQWELLSSLIPPKTKGYRPRTVDLRAVIRGKKIICTSDLTD